MLPAGYFRLTTALSSLLWSVCSVFRIHTELVVYKCDGLVNSYPFLIWLGIFFHMCRLQSNEQTCLQWDVVGILSNEYFFYYSSKVEGITQFDFQVVCFLIFFSDNLKTLLLKINLLKQILVSQQSICNIDLTLGCIMLIF